MTRTSFKTPRLALVAAAFACSVAGQGAANAQPADRTPSFVVIAPAGVHPGPLASDGAGGEWFDETGQCDGCPNSLVRLDETTHAIQRLRFGSRERLTVQAWGADPSSKAMWFSYSGAEHNGIGYVDLRTHEIVQRALPGEEYAGSIAAGPRGTMWFTFENYDGTTHIGRIDGRMKSIHTYSVPRGHSAWLIAMGSDGALWFTEKEAYIGRFDLSTHRFSAYPIDKSATGLKSGPDGAIWFTQEPSTLGRLDLATHKERYYSTPPSIGYMTARHADLWFIYLPDDKLLKFTPATGKFATYKAPPAIDKIKAGTDASFEIMSLTLGSDGQLWAYGSADTILKLCPELNQAQCAGRAASR